MTKHCVLLSSPAASGWCISRQVLAICLDSTFEASVRLVLHQTHYCLTTLSGWLMLELHNDWQLYRRDSEVSIGGERY
jgi:hypothetical protein